MMNRVMDIIDREMKNDIFYFIVRILLCEKDKICNLGWNCMDTR